MRLFVGVPIPLEIASALSELAGNLPEQCRRTPPGNMHITLSFLGQVREEQLAPILASLGAIIAPRFAVTVPGLGSFPGVVFAKVDLSSELNALAAVVSGRMRDCGYPPDERPYRPHITLARHRGRALKVAHTPLQPMAFTADAIVLYRSVLGPGGSRYEELRRFVLAS